MIDIQKEIFKKYPKFKDNKLIKASLSKFAKTIVHEDAINDFLHENSHLIGFEFADAVLESLNVNYTVAENELENIPVSGRVVIIANHPLGSIDGFILLKLIGKIRQDVKIVTTDILNSFKSLDPLLLRVDNFKNKQTKKSINNIYDALNSEKAVIIFPSGEVSRMTPMGVRDGKWQKGFLKFAKRTMSPILPIFIDAKNSKTFYSVSTLNKKISTLLLSHEMFKQRNNTLKIKIGELIPIASAEQQWLSKESIVDLFKQQVYSLKNGKSLFKTLQAIAHPEDPRAIKNELKDSELIGKTKDGKLIYLYENTKESTTLKEIGRLREISFRKIGEGTNKRRDLDKYDKYYKHIVLWDENDLEIVGSYRIGVCSDIVESHGVNGLYNTTLFNFSKKFEGMLDESIEMGRSFVQPKYWGTRALDYLWYGIGAYLSKNPHIRYLYGGVSLSDSYSMISKDIIFYFFDTYFGDKNRLASAYLPYNFKEDTNLTSKLDGMLVKNNYKEDFKTIKTLLKNLDSTIPTLYKQYSELCEDGGIKFCAYNIDEDFTSCVDSFIVVDVSKMKEPQRKRYIESHN